MYQPIRGQDGHVGFRIHLKSNNTWSGPHKEYLWQVWSWPFSRSLEEVQNVSANQRPGWPLRISDWLKK